MAYRGANRAFGRLMAAVEPGDISLSLRPTDPLAAFPTLQPGDHTYATIFAADGNPGAPEDVRITAINANVLTVTRGVGGTVAQAWQAGDRVELRTVNEIFEDIAAPPPPRLISEVDYAALDPVEPQVWYGVPEAEELEEQPDTLLTGDRIIAAYRQVPAGKRLTPADLDGFTAAVQTVQAGEDAGETGGFTLYGPLVARAGIPAAANYALGASIDAATCVVAPARRSDYAAASPGATLTWNTYRAGFAVPQLQPVNEDGWWFVGESTGAATDRVHLPAGSFGPEARAAYVDVGLGTGESIRVKVYVAPATTGRDAVLERVLMTIEGGGTVVTQAKSLAVYTYRMGVVVGA